MVVIVEKEVREVSRTMVAGLIRSGIGPLAGDGLDKALGLAISLRPVGFGEEMFDLELATSRGEVVGAVGSAAVGEDALNDDPMSLVEIDRLIECGDDAFDLLVREETGESEAGVIVDGNVQGFDAGVAVAQRAIAGGTDARTREAAQLLNVEMKEFAGMGAFVTLRRRFGAIERGETLEAVAAQDAGDGGERDLEHGKDLGVGTALSAQREDVGFEPGTGAPGLVPRSGRMVGKLRRKAAFSRASQPSANGFFADVIGRRDLAQGEVGSEKMGDHFGSHPGGESGISVHVVRGVWRWAWYSSTTSLHDHRSADNVLKHDT